MVVGEPSLVGGGGAITGRVVVGEPSLVGWWWGEPSLVGWWVAITGLGGAITGRVVGEPSLVVVVGGGG